MDGFQATSEIRRHDGVDRHTVIIAHTAHSAEDVVRRCNSAGMDDFLAKPVSLSELAQVLDAWVRHSANGKQSAENIADRRTALTRELDERRLAEIEDLSKASGQNILNKLVSAFLTDLPGRLAALESAVERGDFKTFASEAHALRGASQMIGAKQLASLCASAEDLARAGNASDTRTSVSDLMRYARSLPDVLRRATTTV
jgi:HPt (histidine-containing phosphotransfer) domain-containing protein